MTKINVSFLGSKGGEQRLIKVIQKQGNAIEAAEFVTKCAPNNSRWRRFALKLQASIKSRAKTAITAKAALMQFIQAK